MKRLTLATLKHEIAAGRGGAHDPLKWTIAGLGTSLDEDEIADNGDPHWSSIRDRKVRLRQTTRVPLRSLHIIQPLFGFGHVADFLDNPNLARDAPLEERWPVVRALDGKLTIMDGTHRCIAAALSGKKTIEAIKG